MLNRTALAVLALLAACTMATSVNAHTTLKAASPAADGAAADAPTEIRLSFSDRVILKFSSVELKDQAGMMIATGELATDPKDQKQLVVPLETPLKAGKYSVKWRVLSVDNHRADGSYSFKVDR